jgi:hypothetical protein
MQRAVRTTALVIIPLAAAIHANAGIITGPILPSGGASCQMSSSGGCVGGAANFPPVSENGLVGVSLFTSGYSYFSSGGSVSLTLSATGSLPNAGIPDGTTIPLNWVFSLKFLEGGLGGTVSDWTLDFQLLDGASVIGDSGAIDNPTIDNVAINSSGQFFTGSSSMTTSALALMGDPITERVTLDIDFSAGDADQLGVSVPEATSFDYQSVQIQSTPEPGTMGLTAAGFALAGFALIRRKSRWLLVRRDR